MKYKKIIKLMKNKYLKLFNKIRKNSKINRILTIKNHRKINNLIKKIKIDQMIIKRLSNNIKKGEESIKIKKICDSFNYYIKCL